MDIKNYEIILTDTAREELEAIYEYIAKKLYAEPAANRLMEKIEQSFLNLKQNPYIWTKVCVKHHNDIYRRLIVDNYIALYDINEDNKQVIVYRVLYGGMNYLNVIDEI